jgi:hypothetical protein
MKRFLLAAVFVTSPAFATSYQIGHDLLDGSRANDRLESNPGNAGDAWLAGVFNGYVLGVSEAISGLYACPNKVKAGQIITVVQKYLKAHPERLDSDGAVLVTKALSEAFPCKK